MNDTLPPTPLPVDQTAQPKDTPPKSPESGRTRTGKVARLPKVIRDKLNIMLLDGVPFGQILTNLGEAALGVTEQNITSWVAGGHKDWLAEQHRLEETRVKQEVAMDLACPDGGSLIHEATLQLAATRLTDMVRAFDYSDFRDLLRTDPDKLIPFLNSLARISEAEIACERHRLLLQDRELKLQKSNEKKSPGLSPQTRQVMEKDLNLM